MLTLPLDDLYLAGEQLGGRGKKKVTFGWISQLLLVRSWQTRAHFKAIGLENPRVPASPNKGVPGSGKVGLLPALMQTDHWTDRVTHTFHATTTKALCRTIGPLSPGQKPSNILSIALHTFVVNAALKKVTLWMKETEKLASVVRKRRRWRCCAGCRGLTGRLWCQDESRHQELSPRS